MAIRLFFVLTKKNMTSLDPRPYTLLLFRSLLFVAVGGIGFYCALSKANVVGTDLQNFNPTTNGLDFVTVHSSETLEPGILNFGLFLNYALNTLPSYDSKSDGITHFSDSLLSADLNFGLGLMKGWDFGVSFPQVISQNISQDAGAGGEYAETGLTEIRASTKLRFWGDASQGAAFILSTNVNQVQDNPFVGEGGGPTYNFEIALDTTIERIAFGLNLGYRIRNPGEPNPNFLILPIENQFIASGAASYLFEPIDTKVILEILGAVPAQQSSSDDFQEQSVAEILLGAKHDLTSSLALHGGVGTALLGGVSSPDFRIYAGVNWTLGPIFGKKEDDILQRVSPAQAEINEAADATLGDLEKTTPIPAPLNTDNIDFSTLQPKSQEDFIVREILFEFDSDRVNPGANTFLSQLVDHLNKPPKVESIVIEGHTDSVGKSAYNLALSERRALNVRTFLVDRFGLNGAIIRTRGFGETQPIADNGNFQGRRLNRRVEFKVYRERPLRNSSAGSN